SRCILSTTGDEALRVMRDHQLLVRRNYPGRDTTVLRADASPAVAIGVRVEVHSDPRGVATDALADRGTVLSDAGGEHERVQPAERGRERAQLAPDAMHVDVDRELRSRIARLQQLAHVARDPGDSEQARLVVEKLLDRTGVHP